MEHKIASLEQNSLAHGIYANDGKQASEAEEKCKFNYAIKLKIKGLEPCKKVL